MGSSRLPGKVLLPLECEHVLEHVVRRVSEANRVDETVVATSDGSQDDVIADYADRSAAGLSRGPEEDVLRRMYECAQEYDAETVVRVTADCPLLPSACVDAVIERLSETEADYASNIIERTLPRGFDVEAFTMESFRHIEREAKDSEHREHVTLYYLENTDLFDLSSVRREDIFGDRLSKRVADLRLTLDEAADYELLRQVYENVNYKRTVDIHEAIAFVRENGIADINSSVEQKSHYDGNSNSS
jgi:spore coat polysaccharide biosynthesis protein SpsF